MHEKNVMHRDLKCANVFMNKDGTVKLGDMNVSKVANNKGLNFTQTGTPYYASPEIWLDKPYDIKSDVWSLGCVLYEMTALYPPF
jgi:NIMA (never in mitosis gene a)-related kinase 1/4/5